MLCLECLHNKLLFFDGIDQWLTYRSFGLWSGCETRAHTVASPTERDVEIIWQVSWHVVCPLVSLRTDHMLFGHAQICQCLFHQ